MIVFFNGQFLELEEVKISPYDRGFQYADGVYEVIRTYYGKLFRYQDHLERLKKSLEAIKIDYSEIDKLDSIIYKIIEKNNYTYDDFSIYIQITRGESYPRKHSFPSEKINPTVFISVTPLDDASNDNTGIKIIFENDFRWQKCDIKSISLLASVLANQHAVEEDAGEAIWNRDGYLLEGSHTNFWAIKNEEVWTAPLSNLILPGVSRKVIIEVCRNSGIKVSEQAVRENEINSFDEFFVSGTTSEIKPVVQINDWIVGDGKPGKITNKIHSEFNKYVQSKIWL
ncbi:MAG: D-amino-acid transaminase [Bacteroidetes bacterium]|nr:D-amino-acid transaminase [Bacteroidota bacterium]